MTEGPRVLVISDDDDVTETLLAVLKRAGYRVGLASGREAAEELSGPPPDVLILDRDLPADQYRQAIALLEPRAGRASFPLAILGGGPSPLLPRGWHEDAWRVLARPPEAGEAAATVGALLRLGFYRPYRDLVHDLSGPVTTLHALSREIARTPPADPGAARTVELLAKEADRLMTLLEEFQRAKRGSPGPAA